MPTKLVIVESPTKAKTIKRFLGQGFTVEASMGHVRDLPSSTLAVDTTTFEPVYEVPKEKQTVVKKLQDALNKSDELWIATDEDREGEAIGWHLTQVLKRKTKQPIKRIVFHEITKTAIEVAAKNPREMDLQLVDAQQARRVLDRLVGYTLSPFLWKKVYRGLSAGRVQSVAVRVIVDREREILAFKTEEYWTIEADLETKKKEKFTAQLKNRAGKKYVPTTEEESTTVVNDIKGKPFMVETVEEKELKKTPPPPFTTSTLQQEAGRKLGFSVKQTMVVAQQLYEGLDVGGGEGTTGLITYMRTDSVSLSATALADAKETIAKVYGREYVLSEPRTYKTKSKGAQEAHEAIRPTELRRTPDSLKDVLDHQQLKLYTLIWNRTMATQMPPAELRRVGADIAVDKYTFRATGQTITFDGYLRVYQEGTDDEEQAKDDDERLLPPLAAGDDLHCRGVRPEQHFTKPPARYTEASLVKKLEEEGIGRPSTYAPTISTIQQRGYIAKEGKQLKPEEVAFTVTDLLTEHFPDIVNLQFTAGMEQTLDAIAEGNEESQQFLQKFFKPFDEQVKLKTKEIKKEDVLQERIVGKDPSTGLEIVVRSGRFGPYVQLGRAEDMPDKKIKPKSASLPKETVKEEVTMEQALALLSFPRLLGVKDDEEVIANLGRFGPYIRWGKVTVTIPAEFEPISITLAEALELVATAKDRRAKEAEPLKILGTDPTTNTEILLKSGRYGPYVTDGVTNASLPRSLTAETITHDDAVNLLQKKRDNPSTSKKRKWGKKKG